MNDRRRLQRLMGVKERVRDARRGDVAMAEAAHERAHQRVKTSEAALEHAVARMLRTSVTCAEELALRAAHASDAHRDILDARACVVETAAARDEHHRRLNAATRDVRVLEKVDERLAHDERLRDDRREQEFTDEAAARLGSSR